MKTSSYVRSWDGVESRNCTRKTYAAARWCARAIPDRVRGSADVSRAGRASTGDEARASPGKDRTMSKHSMRTSCAAAGAAAISAGLGLVVAATGAAGAGAPTAVALNPQPPDSYTCTPVGNGTRCLSDTTATGLAEDSGIVCGTGAHAFGVMDSATRRVKAERWYDADGNLVKRVRANLFSDAHLSNAVTGAFVSYDQHDVDTDLLAVPGDLDTA